MRRGPCLLVLLFAANEASAQEALGFGEVRASFFPGASGTIWQVVERVRPTLEAQLAERVKLVATIEASFDQGRDLEEELGRAFGCRFHEHENRLLRIDGAGDYLDVDRLYVDVYAGSVDIRVGRQALNWGSAQFFNPTDPFPEVLLAEPWRPRRGVNAARASIPFGEANDVALVIGANDVFDEVRAAGRVRVNWAGIDFALVGAYRGPEITTGMIGLDLRGTLEVGWWIEAAYFLGEDPHEEIAAGIDYSFPIFERATAFVQFYRNGGDLLVGAPCDLGAAFASIRGNHLLLGGSLVIEPELSITFALLQSLDDRSGLAVPTVVYAVLDWLEVSFSAQVPYAREDGGARGLVPDATITVWTRASF